MTELLIELLDMGLIDRLDGDDGRFSKIERAAEAVSQQLIEQPSLLIRAILAGLDPNILTGDPIIVQAEQALVTEWKSMRSVYPDRPVNLLRAILLDACNQAAKDNPQNAAILWLTAANTLEWLGLGKEKAVVCCRMEAWAASVEKSLLNDLASSANNSEQAVITKKPEFYEITETHIPKSNREGALESIRAHFSPQKGYHQQNSALSFINYNALTISSSENIANIFLMRWIL